MLKLLFCFNGSMPGTEGHPGVFLADAVLKLKKIDKSSPGTPV